MDLTNRKFVFAIILALIISILYNYWILWVKIPNLQDRNQYEREMYADWIYYSNALISRDGDKIDITRSNLLDSLQLKYIKYDPDERQKRFVEFESQLLRNTFGVGYKGSNEWLVLRSRGQELSRCLSRGYKNPNSAPMENALLKWIDLLEVGMASGTEWNSDPDEAIWQIVQYI